MSGEFTLFPQRANVAEFDLRDRMGKLAAILAAIDAGELLAALPDCPAAQRNHCAALDLLSIVEIEVNAVYDELCGRSMA